MAGRIRSKASRLADDGRRKPHQDRNLAPRVVITLVSQMQRRMKNKPTEQNTMHEFEQCTIDGLVDVSDDETNLSLSEQLAVHEARDISSATNTHWKIHAILFRRFADNRTSQIAAYIINNKTGEYDKNTLADLQQKLWLNGRAPLVYVYQSTRVDILSCVRDQEFWKNGHLCYTPSDQFKIGASISSQEQEKAERYRFAHLADGTFWNEDENANLARVDKTAHNLLIEAVINADRQLDGNSNPALRRLLLIFVLIKYLEDRGVFPPGWFGENYYSGAQTFLDVLSNAPLAKTKNLLLNLKKKFNGDVFTLTENDWSELTEKQVKEFAKLIDTKLIGQQLYLWDQYSFRYIPTEVLSQLYQHFSNRSQEAIFTPPFLSSLLLDYTMPFENISGKERICDPTCGSGIFLVGALRRLIAKWRRDNNWRRPKVEELKKILRTSIYGVELQGNSLPMAAFNLALAVCDALMPDVIWKDLKFDNLIGTNLFSGDFFANIDQLKSATLNKGFDVILGNPPFASEMTPAGIKLEKALPSDFPELPDKQIAYSIARHSMNLLTEGGKLCLIQPSGLLYNKNPEAFWCDFLTRYQIDTILDFTSIRNLYYDADPKTVAIIATNKTPKQNHVIQHETFRRTRSVKERICFELDHYDCHALPQGLAESYRWVWRANLLGGGRLLNVTQRLSRLQTLDEYIEQQGWDYGEGFIAAQTGRRTKEPWLTGKPLLPSSALTATGINTSKIIKVEATHFRSAYTPKRYSGPMVLIKANEALPIAYYNEGFLAYKAKIIGITAQKNTRQLQSLHKRFINSHEKIRACVTLFGTQYLVGKATAILKQDLDACPWPDNEEELKLNWWEEQVLFKDLIHYIPEYIRLGHNSELLTTEATSSNLENYASLYVTMLGSAYPNLKSAGYRMFGNLICQRFCFGDESTLNWGNDWTEPLEELVYHKRHESLRTVRVIYHYHGNTILIIKPNRLRYWIGSTAIRDADDTLTDLQEQGF